MSILVTGGAGFIGSNFLYHMTQNYPGIDIICVDALTYAGNIQTIYPLIQKNMIKFVKADISDEKIMDKLFSKYQIETVINFAAESHVDNSIKNPSIFVKTNIVGVQVLLDACKKYKVDRFHQVSTDEVYGDFPIDSIEKFKEESMIKPSSPYSASKASADLLVNAYHRTYNMNTSISRCSNNYGPFQFPEKLIPTIITKILKNEKIPLYGDGKNIRDWIYVNDHCEAIDTIIQMPGNGSVYNIGGESEQSNYQVVKKILDFMGKDESLISYVKDRPGHDRRYAICNDKIRKNTKWKPTITFEKGIEKTIEWYLSNKNWIENISSGNYLIRNKEIKYEI